MIKGLLSSYGVEPEEHHSISRLVAQVRLLDHAIGDAVANSSILTEYAVLLRYPPRFGRTRTIDRADGLAAARIALDAYAVLEAAIGTRIASNAPPA